jgi:hypothetical protein
VKDSSALALVPSPPVARGRLLTVGEIQRLVPGKSRWWATQRFCPEHKVKIGRDCYWYEMDAQEWIARQRAGNT